jgi:hypothetical protein
MKICPVCNQTYADDNLNYCLNDGAALNEYADDAPPTVMLNRARTTQQNWENVQTPMTWQNQPLQQNQTYQALQQQNQPRNLAQIQGQNQTLPTISLVLGIFAIVFICCYGGLPFGAAALVTGYLGLKNANENPAQFGGRNLAIGGIVTGVIGLLISIIFFIVLLAG